MLIASQPHLNLAAVAAAGLAGAATATIVSEHAPPSFEIGFYGGWRYGALRLLVPLLYRRADRVVGVSRGICHELRRTVGGKAIDLIHNPVVPDAVAALAAAPVDHAWLQDRAVPVVMGVGRLAPEKDFPGLVRAVAAVGREGPLRLMILGEGPERGRIEATAREVGLAQRLALPGRVDNVFAYLSRAKLFALSSRFEGFGNALVEGMACGTPVVATDCPVGPREILDHGLFGRLVPCDYPPALARAIADCLADAQPPPGLAQHLRRFTVTPGRRLRHPDRRALRPGSDGTPIAWHPAR